MEGELIQGLPDEVAFDCLIRLPFNSFPAARSVSRRWRKEIDSPYFHALRRSRCLTSPVVVFVQADPPIAATGPAKKYSACATTYRLTLHEPATGSWSSLPPIPSLPHGLPLFCRIAAAGRELVVIGGWDSETWVVSTAIYIYDFAAGTWRTGARMPGPERSFFGCVAAVTGGRTVVLVAGGHDAEKNALRSVLVYDVMSDEWSALPDMVCERDECRAIFLRGSFHVIGGYPTRKQGQFVGSSEVFNLSTWMWRPDLDDVAESQHAVGTKMACASKANEAVYLCADGQLAVLESELPVDVRVATQLVGGEGSVVVKGTSRHGGPQTVYLLKLEPRMMTWTKVATPEEYSGHIQAMCSVEL